jgi:phage gp16-like protein
MTPAARNAALAKVHIAVGALGIDDAVYRVLLETLFAGRDPKRAARWQKGKPSAKDLKDDELRELLDHFRRRGFQFTRPARAGRKRARQVLSKEALLKRIGAHLAEAGLPTSYADGIARRMFGVDAHDWLTAEQLWKLVAALEIDARRKGRATDQRPGTPRRNTRKNYAATARKGASA